MSESECTRKQQDCQQKEDDCWSDIDESLLAQIDAEHPGHETEKAVSLVETFRKAEITPMEAFSKGGYLWVTHLTQQLWCEQQLCYTLMGVQPPDSTSLDSTDHLPLPLPTADRPEVKAGKAVHLARELEVHGLVDVTVTSQADRWGLHVLNLMSSIHTFLAGGVAGGGVVIVREVPIFGDPLGNGHLVFGIIDQLTFDPENYSIRLSELKTRTTARLPGKAQKLQHKMQVLLYKRLWDNLVSGDFSTELFLSKLGLTDMADLPLGKDLLRHIRQSPSSSSSSTSPTTLSHLLSQLLNSAQALVRIGSVEIEYVLQDTGAVIGRYQVEEEEDSDWLERKYNRCLDFWCGRRSVEGVDIEEAWKCGYCEYSPVCEWRLRKTQSLSAQNQQRRSGGEKTHY